MPINTKTTQTINQNYVDSIDNALYISINFLIPITLFDSLKIETGNLIPYSNIYETCKVYLKVFTRFQFVFIVTRGYNLEMYMCEP